MSAIHALPLDAAARDRARPIARDLQAQTLCLWCGPLLALGFGIGFVLLGGYVPPPAPTLSAVEIAELYALNATPIRVGMFICILAMLLLTPWGIGLAMRTPARTQSPALFITQVAMVVMSSLVSVVSCILWSLASFRAGTISPEIILSINDSAWFMFLLTWPSFSVWFVLLGLGILQDTREQPGYPRWAAYLSFWTALLLIPGGLIPFFKTGPFAWNGLLAFYVVVIAFFIWLTAITSCAFRSLQREKAACALATSAENLAH